MTVMTKMLFPGLILLMALSHSAVAASLKLDDNLPLPDIAWQDGDDRTYRLSQTAGKPRILHFWAAWCVPCRKEMPEMLVWKQANSDITVIPLSMDKRIAQSRHFLKKYKVDMPPWLLDKGSGEELKVPVLPYSIFVSADGRQIGHYAGIAPWEDPQFTEQVQKLFGLR